MKEVYVKTSFFTAADHVSKNDLLVNGALIILYL